MDNIMVRKLSILKSSTNSDFNFLQDRKTGVDSVIIARFLTEAYYNNLRRWITNSAYLYIPDGKCK